MSNAHSGSSYRRRLGRAPSPPTWLWYEQIPFQDDSSESDDGEGGASEYESCSEDDEDYGARRDPDQQPSQHHDNEDHSCASSDSGSDDQHNNRPARGEAHHQDMNVNNDSEDCEGADKMEVDDGVKKDGDGTEGETKKDVKGKQRAVDPPEGEANESTKQRERRKKQRKPVYTFRPILTIQKSQGFVWNQDLFVPPYIKDRYITSTSPPNAKGSAFSSSSNPCNDYEVDVVEIRVEEGEYADIIPSRGFSNDHPYRP